MLGGGLSGDVRRGDKSLHLLAQQEHRHRQHEDSETLAQGFLRYLFGESGTAKTADDRGGGGRERRDGHCLDLAKASSGEIAFEQTPKAVRREPAIGIKNPQDTHGFGAAFAIGVRGPRSPSYHRLLAASLPIIDKTLALPNPNSNN